MQKTLSWTTLASVLLVCVVAAGCGRTYTMPWLGYRADVPEAPYAARSIHPAGISTVYVGGFDNKTWRQGLEVDLTRALSYELTRFSSLKLASRDTAQSILSGRLVGFDEDAEVKDENDNVLLKEVTLRVEFHWRDRLTGADIVPPQTISERVRVTPGEITSEYAFREVAQRIAQAMERDW